MAQAQGMHLDGESWGLPAKVLETRRRLWSNLFSLDRSLSLATGRPYAINTKHCMQMKIRNLWIDGASDEEAEHAQEQTLDNPTPALYHLYQQQMSNTLGDIQDECFSMLPMTTSYSTYEKVLELDKRLLTWTDGLPPYFKLQDPDTSMDAARPYLPWQRTYLHSSYHFARITLHRTYVLLESLTGRFEYSRNACISSACADLRARLMFRPPTMADRLKADIGMHRLFNSALILGIIAVKTPHSPLTGAILADLTAYCEKQKGDIWVNEFALAEVKVIELCIASAKRSRRERSERPDERQDSGTSFSGGTVAADMAAPGAARDHTAWPAVEYEDFSDGGEAWLDNWFGPMTRSFPEPVDFQFWEDLVGSLESR